MMMTMMMTHNNNSAAAAVADGDDDDDDDDDDNPSGSYAQTQLYVFREMKKRGIPPTRKMYISMIFHLALRPEFNQKQLVRRSN